MTITAGTSQDEIRAFKAEQKEYKEEIERKYGKTTKQLYNEREKRVRDTIALREADRVPLSINADPANYTNIQRSAAYYDPIGWKRAVREITLAFEPDVANAGLPTSGQALELLGVTNRLYPGWQLPPDYEYQFLEVEFLKAEEYDIYLNDPTDFMIRYFMPRMYTSMEPLAKLPPLGTLLNGFEGILPLFDSPDIRKAARTLSKASREMKKFRKTIGNSYKDLADLGFPPFSELRVAGVGGAPYDHVSSFLRGMQGAMLDMFRNPDKLLAACDKLLDMRIANAVAAKPEDRGRRVGMPLWRGDKSFMSEAQFKKFYWPGLKRALQAVVDLGYTPIPFFEAEFGDRLECLLELPPGSIVASVEDVDIPKALDILRGHTCVLTRGPFSLRLASPREVAQFYKDFFDKYGKGGGLLLNIRLPDNGSKEDIAAMLDDIREHVRY